MEFINQLITGGHHIVQIIVAYTVTLYQAQRRSDDMTMISVGGFTNLEKY